MTNKTAAIRYARALLDVAVKEKADLEQIERELAGVRRSVQAASALEKVLLESGRAGAAQARGGGRADRTREAVADRWRSCCAARRARSPRAAAGPAGGVPRAAARSSERRARRSHDGGAARRRSGAQAIERGLAQVTGRTVTLATHVDPSIIGGVVARIGSTVYDGSVTRQLEE